MVMDLRPAPEIGRGEPRRPRPGHNEAHTLFGAMLGGVRDLELGAIFAVAALNQVAGRIARLPAPPSTNASRNSGPDPALKPVIIPSYTGHAAE